MSWLAVTFTTQEINSLIRAQRELTDVWRRLVKELESLVPRVAHVFLLFFSLGKHVRATRGMVCPYLSWMCLSVRQTLTRSRSTHPKERKRQTIINTTEPQLGPTTDRISFPCRSVVGWC